MRKDLYRAKTILLNKFVYGSLVSFDRVTGCKPMIVKDAEIQDDGEVEFDYLFVDPYTIGQYSGMNDKNDRAIFEGDIVKVHDYTIRCDLPWHEFVGVVGFKDGSYVIKTDMFTHYRWIDYEVEVIGNIYDNKDLIERYELKNVIN